MKVLAIALLLTNTSAIKLRQDGPAAEAFIDEELKEAQTYLNAHHDEEVAEVQALENEVGGFLDANGIHLDSVPPNAEDIVNIIDELEADAITELEANEADVVNALNGLEDEAVHLGDEYLLAQTKGKNKAKQGPPSPDRLASDIEAGVNGVVGFLEHVDPSAIKEVEKIVVGNADRVGIHEDITRDMPDPQSLAKDLKEIGGQVKQHMPPHDELVRMIKDTVENVERMAQGLANDAKHGFDDLLDNYGIPIPDHRAREEDWVKFATALILVPMWDGAFDGELRQIHGRHPHDLKREITRELLRLNPRKIEQLARHAENMVEDAIREVQRML